MKGISLVAPLFNEEGNVQELHRQCKATLEQMNLPYEIIFVDDGSKDKTVELAKALVPVKLIELRRNYGQTAARDAGIQAPQSHYAPPRDGYLKTTPADIPKMIEYMEENKLDVVSGWRKHRKDTFFKRFTSRGANFLRWLIVKDGIHDSGCSLKVYRKECFEGVHLYGEMHRFIPAILKIRGFNIGEMVVNHRPRTAGVTKYNWKRTFKGFVDMISLWFWSKFASRPLHLFGTIGLFLLFFGAISGTISIVIFCVHGEVGNTEWPLLTALLIITGIQFFVFGLIADIVSKTYRETTNDKSYNIRAVTENTEEVNH